MAADSVDGAAIHWETDDLGEVCRVVVDTTVYSRAAIFKTAYWFTDRSYLFLSRPTDHPDHIHVEIRPKLAAGVDGLLVLAREFANSLIDYQVREDVTKQTAGIRDELLKRAFSEARTHRDPNKIGSDETYLPDTGQTHDNDPLKIGRNTGE